MTEPVVLLLLLTVLVVPAVLIARTGRRLGSDTRRRQQLAGWAELRGWRLLEPAEQPVGRWQTWPFTIAGVHRGRDATSRRLDVADGPRQGTFHVLTVALHRTHPPRTLLDGAPGARPPDELPGDQMLGQALGALRASVDGLSVRAELGTLVGWLPGPPLHAELDGYLDALVAVAEALDAG